MQLLLMSLLGPNTCRLLVPFWISFIFILIEKAILVKFPFYLRKRLTSAILCSCLKQHSLILHLILKLQSTL